MGLRRAESSRKSATRTPKSIAHALTVAVAASVGMGLRRAEGARESATCAPKSMAHFLTVLAGHLLPTAGEGVLVAAAKVHTGIALVAPVGGARPVVCVSSVRARGLYHPHTLTGDFLIGGAVVVTVRSMAVPSVRASEELAVARGTAAFGLGGVLLEALVFGCP